MAAVVGAACGSPLSGLGFPEYEGDVTGFSRFCFVCGDRAARGMRARGSERIFGVCRKHGPEWAAQIKLEGKGKLSPEMTNGDVWTPLEQVPRKKSLSELMLEFDPQSFDPLPTNEPEGK